MRARTACLLIVVAAVASAAGAVASAPRAGRANDAALASHIAAVPTLGRKWASAQHGYGEIKPTKIDNGGDPTGLVWHVRWSRWGQRRAVGRGLAYFQWPGLGVADGTVAAPAVVVAYDLGSCRGRLAYRKIEWFFPKYGGIFIPENYINICTGDFGPGLPTHECGRVAVRSPAGQARRIQASGLSCERARALVASSPSVRYLDHGGRFRHGGLFCGSEGRFAAPAAGMPVMFECARGRVDILWELTRK
jgi:hypothetical protein